MASNMLLLALLLHFMRHPPIFNLHEPPQNWQQTPPQKWQQTRLEAVAYCQRRYS
jgi:hypothetical protein